MTDHPDPRLRGGSGGPGDRPPAGSPPARLGSRRLDRAPSERYATDAANASSAPARSAAPPGSIGAGGQLRGPLTRAVAAMGLAAALMVASVAVLVTDALLPFLAAIGGAAAGLLLARAVVPVSGRSALTRSMAVRGAVALAVAGVVVGAAGIWVVARLQGGVLDPIDHFAQTSGVLVPVTALVAAIAAGWGASAGPVQP